MNWKLLRQKKGNNLNSDFSYDFDSVDSGFHWNYICWVSGNSTRIQLLQLFWLVSVELKAKELCKDSTSLQVLVLCGWQCCGLFSRDPNHQMNVNVMVASASSENTLGAICWGFLKASSVEYASAHNSGLFMHRAWKWVMFSTSTASILLINRPDRRLISGHSIRLHLHNEEEDEEV